MQIKTSDILRENIENIMQLWEQRVLAEITCAKYQDKYLLRNSLPKFLAQTADDLSKITDKTQLRRWNRRQKDEKSPGMEHGQERAWSSDYTIDQIIFEYHILREIIFEVIEKDHVLSALEHDVILSALEQAVNDAATEFSESFMQVTASEKLLLERKDALEKVVKSRDEFLSMASHELKTPLSTLKLSAQMFKRSIMKGDRGAYSKEKVEQLANLTDEQVTKLNKLVDDMLDVSRIRTGKITLFPEEFDLCQLVRDVLERMKVQFLKEKYDVPVFETSSEKIFGVWDKLRIEQILINLLTNAIRYGNGKPIKIKLHHSKKSVLISIQDKGVGIAEEDFEKIFFRFERAGAHKEISGLGIGLFIVKSLVEAHGGKIRVKSKVNEGSTFLVELPTHLALIK